MLLESDGDHDQRQTEAEHADDGGHAAEDAYPCAVAKERVLSVEAAGVA